ncbi:MAG: hypothetical protein PHG16_07600 [Lachnospiraceae bacterium]|nr:hypothetical protein [Lachnospiraceae bacterium]
MKYKVICVMLGAMIMLQPYGTAAGQLTEEAKKSQTEMAAEAIHMEEITEKEGQEIPDGGSAADGSETAQGEPEAEKPEGIKEETPADASEDADNTEEEVPADEPENTEEELPADEPENTEGEVPADEPENTEEEVPADEPDNTEEELPEDESENTEGELPADISENTEKELPADEPENTEQETPADIPENIEEMPGNNIKPEEAEKTQNAAEDVAEDVQLEEIEHKEASIMEKPEDISPGEKTPAAQILEQIARPLLAVTNLVQLSSNRQSITPEITVTGEQVKADSISVVLESRSRGVLKVPVIKEQGADGSLRIRMPKLEEDDQYILRVLDEKGEKKESRNIVFSVNHRGTSFHYDTTKDHTRLKDSFTPVIKMENVDTTQVLTCMVNGREAGYHISGNQIQIDSGSLSTGKNQITVAVRDAAGHVSVMKPWEFRLEKTESKPKTERVKVTVKSLLKGILAWLLY